MAEARQEYCRACRQTIGQTGKEHDCSTCESKCPELMPENQDAWQLWLASYTQWRVGLNGAMGLDYNAVFAIAEVYGIEVTPAVFRKVKALEMDVLERNAARQ